MAAAKSSESDSKSFPSGRRRARPTVSLFWKPLSAISAAAFAVEIPFFFLGTPSGHDVEFHLYTWLEVLSQWKQGVIYPRWAELAHFGYGEPRFIFYPPASWTLGAFLSAISPWVIAADIYIWLCLASAGVAMFYLARQWFDRRDATFAAVLYAVNPYHLAIVYWRSAFAELLASSLLPLLLLLVLRAEHRTRLNTVLLAVVLGSAWLTNAPAAVMIHYSFALLILIVAWQYRAPEIVFAGAAAVLLAAAMAAFYLLPALYEQRWVDIALSISAGARPLDNFLFVHTPDAEHDAFNRVISWIAVAEIAATFAVAWGARAWKRKNVPLWLCLIIWAGICAFLMFPASNPLWNVLPKLRYMQFPWRLLLCVDVPFTVFLIMATRSWISRCAIYLTMLGVMAFAWHHYQPPWWDNAADLREMQDNVATGTGYEGTDEYTPQGADPSAVDKSARRATVAGPARAAIHIIEWDAERKLLTADLSAADILALKLFNYPAWKVEVNDRPVRGVSREGTGQMLIPVQAGMNKIEIIFVRTWDRKLGAFISAFAILLAVGLLCWPETEPHVAGNSP